MLKSVCIHIYILDNPWESGKSKYDNPNNVLIAIAKENRMNRSTMNVTIKTTEFHTQCVEGQGQGQGSVNVNAGGNGGKNGDGSESSNHDTVTEVVFPSYILDAVHSNNQLPGDRHQEAEETGDSTNSNNSNNSNSVSIDKKRKFSNTTTAATTTNTATGTSTIIPVISSTNEYNALIDHARKTGIAIPAPPPRKK